MEMRKARSGRECRSSVSLHVEYLHFAQLAVNEFTNRKALLSFSAQNFSWKFRLIIQLQTFIITLKLFRGAPGINSYQRYS